MERTHTFDLKDMDEAFWKKIIFAQKVKPSGLGWPCVAGKRGWKEIFFWL